MSSVSSHFKFTNTHEWLDTSQDEMSVGITQHAQELLGDMVYVDLPKVDQQIKAGDEIGVVESVKAAADIYAPISGTIVAINEQVINNPALLNHDPFGAGWLVKIKPEQLEELSNLLNEEQYLNVIGKE